MKPEKVVSLGQNGELKEKRPVSEIVKLCLDPPDTDLFFFIPGHLCHSFITTAAGVK